MVGWCLRTYELANFDSGGGQDTSDRALAPLAIASTAQTVKIDNAGRMLLPPQLRQLLGIERDLYLFTAGTWIEIWDRSRWEEQAYPVASKLWEELYGFDSLKSSPPLTDPTIQA